MNAPEPVFLDSQSKWPNVVLPYGRNQPLSPVIMLHGLESHSSWFVQSARHIASLGHPVYALERRGSGRSTAPRGVCDEYEDLLSDIDIVADQVLELHKANGIHLVGHCFGAIPATAYACRFASNLKSLVLVTPGICTEAEPSFLEKLKILWAVTTGIETRIPVGLKADWFSDREDIIHFIAHDHLALESASARLYWETRRARKYIRRNTDRLTMPIFMALAGRDRICDNARNRQFFKKIPSRSKKSETYPDAVHILEFSSEKDAFFLALSDWFTGVET